MPESSRRSFLAAALSGLTTASAAAAVTGSADPRLAPFDRLMTALIDKHACPGAALAVTRGGRLVYARGFGHADRRSRAAVAPTALFRIASVSKPVTAVAVLRLVERGKLRLNDRAMDRLELRPHLEPGGKVDPRWRQITVEQLLQHTAGWDRGTSYDPIGIPWKIAAALGGQPPVTPGQIVRYMLGQPLDFAPGERYAYSNLGYLVLGRLIEAASGLPYATFVQREVLQPLGIRRMRLGRALPEQRAKGEVSYHDAKTRTGRCLYPPRRGQSVPLPDGAENLEGFEAHGGWIASAIDLVRFASAFDDAQRSPLLKAATIASMWARPQGRAGHDADGKPTAAYYGCGWSVRPVGTRANTWHTGLIAGTSALLVRRHDGLNWAVLFNTQENREGKTLAGLIDPLLHTAANEVKRWPDHDLFDRMLGEG